MKKLKLLFVLLAGVALFASCGEDKDEITEVQYTIVGITNQDLPEEWQDVEELGFSVATNISIDERKGKNVAQHLQQTIDGLAASWISRVSHDIDNLKITFTVIVYTDDIQVDITTKTFERLVKSDLDNIISLADYM
ncbi:MAG: hypothetical protein SPJ75_04405 [Candidatus Onthomorpha sp.]|nr:hypothetical protein [Bacteroidales bacterium]MCI7408222.1 hypothetical protein [Bacteroidales bacterium]MCI7700280.1 hypothetical protein [Bacteroidales bacterium]MDD7590320.1 hypothetical protein [Bacteroidales bacterium]MDY5825726.1 hypothetical protein [Candidatus Onthomorpha sp.]